MLNVIARIDVVPGKMDEFVAIFLDNVPNVRSEDGCIRYDLCRDSICDLYQGNPDTATVVESWESLDHLKAHLATPHMKAFAEAVKNLRTGMQLTLLEPIE